MAYVDAFVIPIPKKNLKAYQRLSKRTGKLWIEHGALEYRECVGDDLDVQGVTPFPKQLKVKPDETVVFSWIVYKSKSHRDQVNKRVESDPRLVGDPSGPLFDSKRMVYGGFKTIVEL